MKLLCNLVNFRTKLVLYKIIRWHSDCILIHGHNCLTAEHYVQEKMKIYVYLHYYVIN